MSASLSPFVMISIHALREEGDKDFLSRMVTTLISIHALREEGDLQTRTMCAKNGRKISIHALREEGDVNEYRENKRLLISIHALREEGDYPLSAISKKMGHFYPRPPRGGRLRMAQAPSTMQPISIHALREEGDMKTGKTTK